MLTRLKLEITEALRAMQFDNREGRVITVPRAGLPRTVGRKHWVFCDGERIGLMTAAESYRKADGRKRVGWWIEFDFPAAWRITRIDGKEPRRTMSDMAAARQGKQTRIDAADGLARPMWRRRNRSPQTREI